MFDTDIEEIEAREMQAPPIVNQDRSLMQVRTSFTTAVHVQKPRNLRQVEKDFLEEADLAGDDFYYGWSVKNKQTGKTEMIEGPSIGLAKSILRCWGNCGVEMLPLQETPASWIFTAAFIDLEKGVTLTRQFRQAKNWTVYGAMDAARKDDVRFQIGQSKAIRNVIINAVPGWLVEKGKEKAKQGELAKLEKFIVQNGIEKARTIILDELKKFGVSHELVLAKLERATVNAITKEDIVILKGDVQALRTGTDYVEALYPFNEAVAEKKNGNGADSDKPATARLSDELRQRAAATKLKSAPAAAKQEKHSKPTAEQEPDAAEQKRREAVSKLGLNPDEMLMNGPDYRYALGDEGALIDQATGELVQPQENGESVPAEQQDPGVPFPPTWADDRKTTLAIGKTPFDLANPKMLAQLIDGKDEKLKRRAVWDARLRIKLAGEYYKANGAGRQWAQIVNSEIVDIPAAELPAMVEALIKNAPQKQK